MDSNAPPTWPLPPPPPPPPPPPFGPFHPRRPLRRDRSNGMLGGVCAGVADAYGIDVTLVRVVWIIAGIFWIGIPAYIVAWIVMAPAAGPQARVRRAHDAGILAGLVLVAIGVMIASNELLPFGFRFDHFGAPLLLIGGGLAILLLRRSDDDVEEFRADAPAPSPPPTGPSPETESAPDPASEAPTEVTEATEAASEPTTETAFGSPPEPPEVPPSAWTQTGPWPVPPSEREMRREWRDEHRRARRPRSFLTPLTLSVLLIGAGIASLLQATGAVDVNLTVALAIATCVVGAALVVAAFAGRAHTLILVGIMLLAATAVSNSIDVPLRGGIGSRTYRPLQLSELQPRYALGIGRLEIDLRDVPLTDGTTVVDAQTGVGELLVLVPSSVRVEVRAHAGAGSVMLFGRDTGGWPEDDQRAVDGTGSGVLQLNLRVGAGQVRVRRFEPGGIETILRNN